MSSPVQFRVVPRALPARHATARIAREFRALIDRGARLRPAGRARHDPLALLSMGYTPKRRISLFDTHYYLTNVRQNPEIRFFVAYVVRSEDRARPTAIYPRIFYKDVSLVWRSASHYVPTRDGIWVGKGDTEHITWKGEEYEVSKEESTNLPLEIQDALEQLARRMRRIATDHIAVELILRRGAAHRIAAFADFTAPKRQANQACPINGGLPVARFRRHDDPTSLVFTPGFEPDLAGGLLEIGRSRSRLYGGGVQRHRILSTNRRVQYLFFSAPRHVWVGDCQATSTEITSYGVRSVDVPADEMLFLPGYEYHLLDEPDELPMPAHQIPPGFVGPLSDVDPHRADTSPWLDRVPVIRAFRRKVLARR